MGAARNGLQRFRTEQPPYSILNRGIERVRKGGTNDLKRAQLSHHLTDERRLDVVERLIPLAAAAGLPMTHLAMAFTVAHPGVTSALLGPRTTAHLDDLLDEIVPPGTDISALDQDYRPPALQDPHLRRRPPAERSAA